MSDTQLPNIVRVSVGCSSRGAILVLTLDDIGRVEVTTRELKTARRFARAVYKQTGHEFEAMDDRLWQQWLIDSVRKGGRHV